MSKQPYCTVLGILDDGWAGLPDSSRHCLQSAGLIVGASHGEGALRVGGKTDGYYRTTSASVSMQRSSPSWRRR